MKYYLLGATALLGFATGTAFSDDVPQPPRTHIDTTVVGSTKAENPIAPPMLQNHHQFEAGAPDILKITNQLHLSVQQKAQIHDVIERADAGAAVLINREHDVSEMLAATTPDDPHYAKLVAEQSTANSRWSDNRDSLRRDVLAILSPAQRARFEELDASR